MTYTLNFDGAIYKFPNKDDAISWFVVLLAGDGSIPVTFTYPDGSYYGEIDPSE